MIIYITEERAYAPGIVKQWPNVIRLPKKIPHGRLRRVEITDAQWKRIEGAYNKSRRAP